MSLQVNAWDSSDFDDLCHCFVLENEGLAAVSLIFVHCYLELSLGNLLGSVVMQVLELNCLSDFPSCAVV